MLCFVDALSPLLCPPNEFRAIRLESPRSLRKLIVKTQALGPDEIDRLARVLGTALPPR